MSLRAEATETTQMTSGDRDEAFQESSPLDLILVVLVLAFAALGLRPLADPDLWWHLRAGELIVNSGFTTSDPWSHASSNPWLLHQWVSEVVMYASYAIGGYHGVILLHSVMMLVLAIVLVRSIRKQADPGIATIVATIALVAVLLGSAERPQLVSWVLLAAVLPALRAGVAARRPPWWLIPVTWLWANLHGLWSAVLVLFAFLVLGLIIEVGVRSWSVYRGFVAVGLLSGVAAGLTPNGPRLLLAPLHVREYARFVSEWNPPSILDPFLGCAFLLLAIVAVSWGRSRRPVPASDITLVVAAAFIGLAYIRTIPVLAITLAPLAAAGLQQMYHRAPPKRVRQPTGNKVLGAAFVLAFVVGVSVWLPRVAPVFQDAPWKASQVLDALPGRARVLNEYGAGGWLLWTARDTSPAVDGRAEIYAPEYVEQAVGAPRMNAGWQSFVAQNDFDAAWLYQHSPLVYALRTRGWTEHFRDKNSIILVPPRQ